MEDRAAIVMGAGNATGGAIARRFAREGYTACISRRNVEKLQPLVQRIEEAGGRVRAFGADARKEDQVQDMFRTVEEEVGPIEVCVFNVGGNVRFSLEETTSRVFYKVWEMGCFAGFLTGREAVRYMKPRGRGTILFTGATSSMRGASGFAAFSGAKFGLRSLAQSLAREFGPQGIHVAHIIIDGAIDTEWIQELFPETYAKKEEGGFLILKKSQKPIGSFTSRNAVPGPRKWTSDPGWSISDFILKLFLYKNLFIIPALNFLTV
jgi:NAD(P)-dependent dehydrogenase (short-subunit alcohol dehydrogenase family)